ncbi:TMEM62 [Cordylochernes scorpioides]|uniref:TMEM62 n=1 Tax=Cordylochernes scorpioides TaxID=51811 RepID=A0ABY6LQ05_9ARAC|nr:TMEM62 [Cordylochernes scorpioides]
MMEMTRTDPEWKDKIITGDETWVYGYDPETKPQSAEWRGPTPPAMIIMLGVIYYELLQPNETITGEPYQQQLMRLSRALKIKRPLYAKRHDKVIHQQDNARPHVAKVVKETLEALQWDVLRHSPYSPDLAPSDYHMTVR